MEKNDSQESKQLKQDAFDVKQYLKSLNDEEDTVDLDAMEIVNESWDVLCDNGKNERIGKYNESGNNKN